LEETFGSSGRTEHEITGGVASKERALAVFQALHKTKPSKRKMVIAKTNIL